MIRLIHRLEAEKSGSIDDIVNRIMAPRLQRRSDLEFLLSKPVEKSLGQILEDQSYPLMISARLMSANVARTEGSVRCIPH